MALDDIVFSEGERQNFVLEIDLGTLNEPDDILSENPLVNEVVPSPPTRPEVFYVG